MKEFCKENIENKINPLFLLNPEITDLFKILEEDTLIPYSLVINLSANDIFHIPYINKF